MVLFAVLNSNNRLSFATNTTYSTKNSVITIADTDETADSGLSVIHRTIFLYSDVLINMDRSLKSLSVGRNYCLLYFFISNQHSIYN